jgi:hypothetical protein
VNQCYTCSCEAQKAHASHAACCPLNSCFPPLSTSMLHITSNLPILYYCSCPVTSSSRYSPRFVELPHASVDRWLLLLLLLSLHRRTVRYRDHSPRTECSIHQAHKRLPDRLPCRLLCHGVHCNPGPFSHTGGRPAIIRHFHHIPVASQMQQW